MKNNYGINLVLKKLDRKSLDSYLSKINHHGFSLVRLDIDFNLRKDKSLGRGLDYIVKRLYENNVTILGLITGHVHGTFSNMFSPSEQHYSSPFKNIDEYSIWLDKTVRRYSKYINIWEIWNEANMRRFWIGKVSPKEYGIFFKRSFDTIKNIDNKLKVMMGSVCGNDVITNLLIRRNGFLKDVIDQIGDIADYYGIHPYIRECYFSFRKNTKSFYLDRCMKLFEDFKSFYPKLSQKVWITEFGISTKHTWLSKAEAVDIHRHLHEAFDKINIPYYIWNLVDFDDKIYSSFNPEKYFGI